MRSDLILMIFERQGEAQRVYDAIQSMRKEPLLGLENAAVVTKDSAGTVSLYNRRLVPVHQEAASDDLLSLVADLVFGTPPEDVVRALSRAGMDDRFVPRVTWAMKEDSSALLILVRHDSVSDEHELLRTLALFKGVIYQTTLSPETEAALVNERSS